MACEKRQILNKKLQMCIYDLYRSPCQRKILQGNCLLNSVQFACFPFLNVVYICLQFFAQGSKVPANMSVPANAIAMLLGLTASIGPNVNVIVTPGCMFLF